MESWTHSNGTRRYNLLFEPTGRVVRSHLTIHTFGLTGALQALTRDKEKMMSKLFKLAQAKHSFNHFHSRPSSHNTSLNHSILLDNGCPCKSLITTAINFCRMTLDHDCDFWGTVLALIFAEPRR